MTGATLASLSSDPWGDLLLSEPAVPDSPERRLARAIIERALQDAMGRDGAVRWRSPRLAAEATAWLESQDASPWSFVWLCAELNLPPGRVRCRLRSSVATAAEAGSERAA